MKLLYIPAPAILSKGYGGMYNWWVTQDSRGICPAGWHIPTDNDFYTMMYVLGVSSIAGGKMKEAGFINWIAPNVGADNSSGLGFKGAGNRTENSFGSLKEYTAIWVSTLYYTYGLALALQTQFETASVAIYSRLWGLSIRLIKDNSDWQSGETVTDYDGNVYQTVKVGNQVIMAENYKVKHYNNGDAIPIVTDQTEWANLGPIVIQSSTNYGTMNTWNSVANFEITHAQGFTISGGLLTGISIQSTAGVVGSPNFKVRLSIYNISSNQPTTKICDSINAIAVDLTAGQIYNFEFDQLLPGGQYCFVTSYEDVITHNVSNYTEFDLCMSANYAGGIMAFFYNNTWHFFSDYDMRATININQGAMCYYNNDPANA